MSLELDSQLGRAYDPYAFVRNAWLQRREYQVRDGDVADQSLELEEEFKDDPPAEAEPSPAPETPAEPPPAEAPATPATAPPTQ